MLYTVKEVAALLRVCEANVRTLIENGELAHMRVGKRRIRIPAQALHDYIAKGTTEVDTNA